MNTDRTRYDPFAPRRKVQPEETTPAEPAMSAPEQPTEQPVEPARDLADIAAEVPADLDDITLKDLRVLAELADVPSYGTKAEIAARLRAAAE